MTFFPKSRWAWVRAGVIAVATAAVCSYRNVFALASLLTYQPQEGDILFQSLPHNDLVDAIEGISQSPWSHCGVLIHKGNSWIVVEAIGVVRETPLFLWIPRGRRGYFEAYRLNKSGSVNPAALQSALTRYLGRRYDFHYAPSDDEIYCSELVYKAYREASGIEIGEWRPLGTLNWKPYEAFIRGMEAGALPLERPMVTPESLAHSKLLLRVYPKGA